MKKILLAIGLTIMVACITGTASASLVPVSAPPINAAANDGLARSAGAAISADEQAATSIAALLAHNPAVFNISKARNKNKNKNQGKNNGGNNGRNKDKNKGKNKGDGGGNTGGNTGGNQDGNTGGSQAGNDGGNQDGNTGGDQYAGNDGDHDGDQGGKIGGDDGDNQNGDGDNQNGDDGGNNGGCDNHRVPEPGALILLGSGLLGLALLRRRSF